MTSLPHGGIGQMPCQTSSRIFDKALATAEIARYNSVEQRSYEENLKVYRALINVVRTTERKGLAKDMAEGRPVSERTRYSSEATGSFAFRRYIIPSSQHARYRVYLCWIISRDFSAKLLKDVGIMISCYLLGDRLMVAFLGVHVKIGC